MAAQHEDALIKDFADSKISEVALTNKDDNDFDGDVKETRSIEFQQRRYDILKEQIERVEDDLHVAIADNKKDVMTKLATKFQKRLEVVAGGLAEHVAKIAEMEESGAVINSEDLKQQINDLWKAINNGPQPNFDLDEQDYQEKNRSTNMDKLSMGAEFKAFQNKVYEQFKAFAGEVDRELKRFNMKLGGLPVTNADRNEMEAELTRLETKIDNVQHWVANVNQKLVEIGHARLVDPQS